MRHFTSNGTDQCRNGSSNLLTPYREQPRSTRNIVADLRPAFSATKRTNYAPISFDQPAQVSRGLAEIRKTSEVHGGGGLELMKPAREPASSRSKPSASLGNAPRILPVRRFLLALVGKNIPWSEISLSLRNLPVRAFDSRAQGFSAPLAPRRSSCPPPSPNLVRTHPIERCQALRDRGPCLSRATTSRRAPNWSSRRGAHLGIPSSTNHTTAASQPIG